MCIGQAGPHAAANVMMWMAMMAMAMMAMMSNGNGRRSRRSDRSVLLFVPPCCLAWSH